eukprot:COSAG06_NODE_38523_length_422_cov_1.535604_1_plen_75_part_10
MAVQVAPHHAVPDVPVPSDGGYTGTHRPIWRLLAALRVGAKLHVTACSCPCAAVSSTCCRCDTINNPNAVAAEEG